MRCVWGFGVGSSHRLGVRSREMAQMRMQSEAWRPRVRLSTSWGLPEVRVNSKGEEEGFGGEIGRG